MPKLKIISFVLIFALAVALLCGCGANVSTVMTVNTADGGFTGTRVITVLIENEDLQTVTGGMDGLLGVLSANCPADLPYVVEYPSDTQSAIVFTLSFTSLDDYRTKVTTLLALSANNTMTPEVTYEHQGSIFKEGTVYYENFTSFDLLRWYFDALETANIISESSSNWYEMGTDQLVINDEVLDEYGNYFDVDNQRSDCLDDCDVTTTMNADGTFDRTIVFKAYESTLEDLAKYEADFSGYMKKLATEGIEYAEEKNAEYGYTTYTYTFKAVSAEQIVTMTNAVLQSENNAFSVELAPKEGAVGVAAVTITESIDASYYLDEYTSVVSNVYTYPNMDLTSGDYSGFDGESFYYYPEAGQSNTFTADWKVSFETAELGISASGKDEMKVKLTFNVSQALPENIQDIAFTALEEACAAGGSYKRDGSTATYTVSGKAEKVAEILNKFVVYYVASEDMESDSEYSYCEAMLDQMDTESAFTKGTYGELSLSLTPVLGNMNVILDDDISVDITSSYTTDEEGVRYVDSYVEVTFMDVQTDVMTVILVIVFALVFVAGVVLCIIFRKTYVELIASLKKPAKAPAEVSDEGFDAQIAEEAAPAPVVEDSIASEPVEETAPAVQESGEQEEEEDTLL